MTRFRIGAALLILLLAAAGYTQGRMEKIQAPIAAAVRRSAEAAEKEDWPAAAKELTKARAAWNAHRNFTAAFADHQPLEDIDSLLAQLPTWLLAEEARDYAALCTDAARKIDAVAEAGRISWGTVF